MPLKTSRDRQAGKNREILSRVDVSFFFSLFLSRGEKDSEEKKDHICVACHLDSVGNLQVHLKVGVGIPQIRQATCNL